MADKKIIAVIGATGAQGGGLVRAILRHGGGFTARAVTRDPTSEKAKALAKLGAEVVQANIDDLASLERAFSGAYGAFFVTFFWDHFSPERETAEARSMTDVAARTGVQHVIWSTLEDTRRFVPLSDDRMPTLMGKYKVPHFDGKGEADPYVTAHTPATCLVTSFYWENLIYFGMGPKPGPDGTLAFTLPMGDRKLASMAVEDIGKCAFGIFQRGAEYIGKTVGIAGAHLSGGEMAAALGRALDRPVRYNAITPAVYRSLGFPGADDLANMFQFDADFEREALTARSLSLSRALNPELLSFDQWLATNQGRIPLE